MPLTLQRRAARLAEAITAVPRLDGETDQSIRPSPIDGEAATIHQWGPERRVRGAAAAGGEERPPCQPLRSLRGGPRPLLRWFHSSSSLDCGPPPCSQCDTIGPRLSSSALLQPASLLATPATSRCPPRQRLSRWTAGGRVVPAHLCTFGRASSGTCQFCCGLMRRYLRGRWLPLTGRKLRVPLRVYY